MAKYSSWAEGAKERRDERATKVDDTSKSLAGNKDTKRWCRGKVDVEHKLQAFPVMNRGKAMAEAYDLCCTVCGRKLDFYFGSWNVKNQKPKPDWVVEYERKKDV